MSQTHKDFQKPQTVGRPSSPLAGAYQLSHVEIKQGIRRNFARRAGSYDRHAEVQRFMAERFHPSDLRSNLGCCQKARHILIKFSLYDDIIQRIGHTASTFSGPEGVGLRRSGQSTE